VSITINVRPLCNTLATASACPWRTAPRNRVPDSVVVVPPRPFREIEERQQTPGSVGQSHQCATVHDAAGGTALRRPGQAQPNLVGPEGDGLDAQQSGERHDLGDVHR
jgi:hypothetical protein